MDKLLGLPITTLLSLLTGVCLMGAMGAFWLRRGRKRRYARIVWGTLAGLLLLSSLVTGAGGGYAYWLDHRWQPKPARETLGPGVEFTRDVRQTPRPLVIGVVEIDLGQPGLQFMVTPGDRSGGRELVAMRTTTFLKRYKLRLAINGGFFDPFNSESPWDYYPREGDPVDVFGLCASRGEVYSHRGTRYQSLNFSREGKASIIDVDQEALAYEAISGRPLSLDPNDPPGDTALQPRTGLALDHDGNRLILMVVDGRQPGYSEGVSLAELAALLAERGGDEALNMDGGGSTTLAYATESGKVRVLNSPIQTRIPGRERPVANHLGLTW